MTEGTDRFADPSVVRVIEDLARAGWSQKDFDRNQMGYAARLVLDEVTDESEEAFQRYWRTAARIGRLFRKASLRHVVIKSRRSYPYSDSNVDVFVEEDRWERVRRILCENGWQLPSRLGRLKQNLIERGKVKLPPTDTSYVAAHVYRQVAWRYQEEVNFLPWSDCEAVRVRSEAPQLNEVSLLDEIPMPVRSVDLLLHSAEVLFENYRITLGEALYLEWLAEVVSDPQKQRVESLARDRGAMRALETALSARIGAGRDAPRDRWPRYFSLRELLACWEERVRKRWNEGHPLASVHELFGYAFFALAYRIKRGVVG